MMTPMIDVVFLLLIFFVCTANFQIPEQVLPSQLQAGGVAAPIQPVEVEPVLERIIVETFTSPSGVRHRVNQRPADSLPELRALLQTIADIDKGLPVILDNGGDVALGAVIDVYDISRLVGLERIQLAAAANQ